MKYICKFKKAFTLIEITIAILIVAILVLLCMPVINNQMRKTEEYSYFAAYKTLEKMAAQILAIGDSSTDNVTLNNVNDFSKFIPSAYAKFYDDTKGTGNNLKAYLEKANFPVNIIANFSEYEWKQAAICMGNQYILNYAGTDYGSATLCNNIYGSIYGSSSPSVFSVDRFAGNHLLSPTLKNYMLNFMEYGNAESSMLRFCKKMGSYGDSFYVLKKGDDHAGNECIVIESSNAFNNNVTLPAESTETLLTVAQKCDIQHGYINGSSEFSGTGRCQCENGVFSANNPKACCNTPTVDNSAYYIGGNNCLNCKTGAFNERTKRCCPNNSLYSASRGECVCNDGYAMNAAKTACSFSNANCPPGTHSSNGVCVQNPPFLRAKAFCNAIDNLWNTNEHNCDTFTPVAGSNINMYSAVYSAATSDGNYLNINATEGAFSDLKPNIVFSNGMKMWILGDRAASIPGLSYNPDAYDTITDTVCSIKSDVTTEGACNEANSFFCKDESRCYSVSSDANGPSLADARNCCSVLKTSDIIPKYAGFAYLKDSRVYAVSGFTVFMDIDGSKGSGTLWEDVFPFYITTDGQVYPAYPLNAAEDSRFKYIAGNSSYLNTDIYYYDVSGTNRHKHYVERSVPLARALCLTKSISVYTPYCQNLGTNFRTHGTFTTIETYVSSVYPCHDRKCYVHVKNKLKFF